MRKSNSNTTAEVGNLACEFGARLIGAALERTKSTDRSSAGLSLVYRSSLVNTLPITKKNKHTVVTEAPKKVNVLLLR